MKAEDVISFVFKAKPELEKLIQISGNKTFSSYLNETYRTVKKHSVPKKRKKMLVTAFGELVENRLGATHRARAEKHLADLYMASTADHHGPLCHPFFANMFLAQEAVLSKRKSSSLIVLPCASVSLDNSSFPRGLSFHDTGLAEKRLPLLSLKYKHTSVLHAPPYKESTVEKLISSIDQYALTAPAKGKLDSLLRDVYKNPQTLLFPSYDEQLTYTNYHLVRSIPQYENYHLYYLPQEELTRTLLEKHLVEHSFLADILLDPRKRSVLGKNFENISGAHSSSEKKGTFFFWGVSSGVRMQLFEEGGVLKDENGTSHTPFEEKALLTALREKRLMPNMALSFIVLSFYHGLLCGGGFSQINYLGDMKRAYLSFLRETGEDDEAVFALTIPTNIFLGEAVVATIGSSRKSVPATLLDCVLYDTNRKGELKAAFSETSLETGVRRMMGEYYKIIAGRYPAFNEWLHDNKNPTFPIA